MFIERSRNRTVAPPPANHADGSELTARRQKVAAAETTLAKAMAELERLEAEAKAAKKAESK